MKSFGKRTFKPLAAIRVALGVWVLLWAWLAAGCGGNAAPAHGRAGAPVAIAPPVGGLVATLANEVRELPEGQIAWTTYWQLCWAAYPGATAYELQPLTSEGATTKYLRLSATCHRVEVAKGQNAKAQGLFNRALMLASLSGQLSYRVRAVLAADRVSEWSPPREVGKAAL